MQTLWQALWTLETLAVVLALVYLLLAARQNLWCWACALLSSLLYVGIFWQARLYTETALNMFYMAMAVAGWWQWQQGAQAGKQRAISRMSAPQHAVALALTLLLAAVNGYVMQRYTDAAWPFVDAFIAWGSVITTILVVRKVLENWLYWIVLDSLGVIVYLERGLYLTALLYAAYVVLVVFGYLRWRREYLLQPALV